MRAHARTSRRCGHAVRSAISPPTPCRVSYRERAPRRRLRAVRREPAAVDVRRRLRPRDEGGGSARQPSTRRSCCTRSARARSISSDRADRDQRRKPHLTDAPYVIAVFEQAWRFEKARNASTTTSASPSGSPSGSCSRRCTTPASRAHPCAVADGLPQGDPRAAGNERPFLLIPVGYPAPGRVPRLARSRSTSSRSSSRNASGRRPN